ncbi:D-alanyl-D-alanine carboxypeptidase family protein [Candidatus Kaiserbacteria bacterium]|nr:D-alanyl-D-alanine carboxypeptidase family protein [Candidatus Kaiserbacteria bacterium]
MDPAFVRSLFWKIVPFAIAILAFILSTPSLKAAPSVGDIINRSPLTTPTDRNLAFGGCSEDPYAILEREHRGGGEGKEARCTPGVPTPRITPQAGRTAGIDSALACRLTKLFKAARDRGCQVKISSAYRSESTQQCMCGRGGSGCAAAGNSCHQPGRAVDVSSSCIGWLRMAARQFQLVFPYYGDHIQCAEHPRASTRSCNTPCNGGLAINPDLSQLPPPSQVPDTYYRPPTSAAPSAGISDAARNFFNPQQQEQMCALSDGKQVPCSSIANPGSQQSLPQQQQPGQLGQQPPALGSNNTTAYASGTCPPQFYCKNETYYYRSSTCVDQAQKKCAAGCSKAGTTCAATSTSETASAFDQIESIAEPTAEEVGTPVSDRLFELAIAGEDIAALEDTSAPTTTKTGDTPYVAPPPLSEQTFISDDLHYSPAAQDAPQELSAMRRVLAMMQDTLVRALTYLQPFGWRAEPIEMHE